ncbi:MAG: flavodoxin domain-containing protein [Trueperaceae bacterium]|nr:flavodoxin domain-containing protein [Trueperaceae bacterium]
MTSLVVFESFFGNTEVVARAIAEALEAGGHARALRVSELEKHHLDGVQLLVVGSATRAFRPSPGTQAWLRTLPPGKLDGVRVAAFDTRVDVEKVGNRFLTFMVRLFGYAAEPIEKALARAGGEVAGPATGFIVEDKQGPLREGETDRARAWARALVGE